MSMYMVEKVIWEMGRDPERARQFLENPDDYLSRYYLPEEERSILKDLDVRAMADRGVSTLLTMMAWMTIKGPEGMPEYMMRMNTPKEAAELR